jgi:hypothetical protein
VSNPQLDTRYFLGLEGQYTFKLHFILRQQTSFPSSSSRESEVFVRVGAFANSQRAVSCEVELKPGTYDVLPKITGIRNRRKPRVEEVIQKYANRRPQKLREIGLNFDLAHRKVFRAEEAKTKEQLAESQQQQQPAAPAVDEQIAVADQQQLPVAPIVVPVSAPSGPGEIEAGGAGQQAPGATYGADPAPAVIASAAPAQDADQQAPPPATPWNAVCVIGLKVYSFESDVRIEIVEPRNPEEAASLVLGD